MFSTGDSFRSQIVLISGASITLVFIITLYTQMVAEMEKNDLTSTGPSVNGNKTMDLLVNGNNSLASPNLHSESTTIGAMSGTEVTTLSVAASNGKMCRKLIMILAKRMMKFLTKCTKSLRDEYPDKEAFSKHFQCAMKCFMRKVNMIDENNQMSNATFIVFTEEYIPPQYHQMIFLIVNDCVNTYAGKMRQDEFCTDHGNFFKCLQDNAADKC